MVEMTETATILHNATAQSLVLMDEIGRGTSTFDGLSLAWAVAHHMGEQVACLHAVRHALLRTDRARRRSAGCVNVHLDATEHKGELVFLHAVKAGPANQSYGLQVAALAGVPSEVIARARGYLAALESQQSATRENPQEQLALSIGGVEPDALRDALDDIEPDALSPREALDVLYLLKKIRHDR